MPQMAAAHDHQLAPTNRRLRTGSGFEGVSIHSSRHTNAPLSCTTHPDLICHILTSSPSIQIRLLPFSGRPSSAYIPRIHPIRWHYPSLSSAAKEQTSFKLCSQYFQCQILMYCTSLALPFSLLTSLSVMPTSEQHPTRCVDPPPAESTCDAICQAGPCCQIAQECELERNPVQYVVGDCVPDGQGGCKRSAPGSPSGCCSPSGHDRPQGVLLWVIVLPDLLIVCAPSSRVLL